MSGKNGKIIQRWHDFLEFKLHLENLSNMICVPVLHMIVDVGVKDVFIVSRFSMLFTRRLSYRRLLFLPKKIKNIT